MPSWLKLTLLALAAFGLGFAAAQRFPLAPPAAAEALAWEKSGGAVRLTAKARGDSYLIVQGDNGKTDSSSKGAAPMVSGPSWSVQTAETINVGSPMIAYRLSLAFVCQGGQCNPCLPADDCGPLVGPFGPVRNLQVWQWKPLGPGGWPWPF